ncbi:MAG: PD-(D/E)XK nuclease family protein [Deltaproteobacteria bacterium]|nr:PD-(D/E)XK nuclease family protein [Deltaproteobacteria bacterium]
MADLTNDFSWSSSRASKFDSCRLAYWFHYYGSWGGWERGASERTHELWVLKKLTGRQAWAGIGVHDAIAEALGVVQRGGELPPAEKVIGDLHEKMRDEFKGSREGVYRRRKALGLVEHEYELPISNAKWKENWERAKGSLEAFYASPICAEICATPPERWLPIDALDTFDFEGTRVYVAPDFAFRDDRDRLRILDWKTGRPREKDHEQVRGYALFAADRWGAEPEELAAELHYLAEGKVEAVTVDLEAIEAYKVRLRESIAAMKAVLKDPSKNEADEADFPAVSDSRECRWCNFRRLCPGAVD